MMFFRPELEVPVRFLAIEWREAWEFDHPSLLIEPVVRYSPNGTSLDNLIQDAAIDIGLEFERDAYSRADLHGGDKKEFEWRRWNFDLIRRKAERMLRGKPVNLGIGYVGVREEFLTFFKDEDGNIDVREWQ